VAAVELKVRGCDRGVGARVGGEDEVEALRIGGAAAETIARAFIDRWVSVHVGRGVASCIWWGYGLHGLHGSTSGGHK
jgi:hypothetical protein